MVQLYDVLKSSYGDKKSIDKLNNFGYKYDSMLSTNNNKVFVNNNDKKLLFTVKGTNPLSLKDIGTDIYLGLNQLEKTNRFKESKNLLSQAKNKYNGYQTIVGGHSLGSSIGSKIFDKKNDKFYGLDGYYQPFQRTRNYNGNAMHYRSQIDPISLFGANSKNVKTLQNKYNPTGILPYDLLKAHNVDAIKNSNIKI
jgi:hypothetical protein